jgi:hypothetical protein
MKKANSAASVAAPIWKVTRWCCRSGQCVDCKQRGNLYGDLTKRQRITHAHNLTKATADTMTRNWREFAAETELM